MHREVPPFGMADRLFSNTYVCARSIDRSAPLRAIFEARFASFGACSSMRGRCETENCDDVTGA